LRKLFVSNEVATDALFMQWHKDGSSDRRAS
jgi:hypothetical protein